MTRAALAILLLVGSSAAFAQGGGTASSAAKDNAPASVLVTTEKPRQGSLPRILTAYGTVTASPDGGSRALSLLRAGQVLQVEVALGQRVKQGQAMLTVGADPATLAVYRQATAALALARGQRTRTAQMLADRMATRDQLAQADNAIAMAQASLDALNREGGSSAEQTLAAPFDGVVTALLATPGARIAAQAPLVTVARSDRLVASVGVEPGQLHLLAPDQTAQLVRLNGDGTPVPGTVRSVGAMVDPQTRLVPLTVAAAAAAVDTRQVAQADPPDAAAPNPAVPDPAVPDPAAPNPAVLVPGEAVRVDVAVGQMRGWLVPRDAVLTDAKGSYLFQVDGAKAVRVDVHVVGMSGATTVVSGKLDPAWALVTSGNYQLQDGAAVREQQPGVPPGQVQP